jgi:methanogenic corrinoid protein MtbC1
VVARRTGLSPDVLRAWEKRYKAIVPRRHAGRRVFTDEDVERLLLLRKATLGGRRISEVASLTNKQLEALVSADEEAASRAPLPLAGPAPAPGGGQDTAAAYHLEACLAATRNLDARSLQTALSRATVALSQMAVLEQVVVPLTHKIGELWREGELRVAHEHLATAVLRTFLGDLGARQVGSSPAHLVVTTPSGQLHELGAILVAATAAAAGWNATYLGANLPAEDIAAAASIKGARAVALSIVYPADDPQLSDQLQRLRKLLPDGVAIIVGGEAARGYARTLESIGARRLKDMTRLQECLETLRIQTARV